MKQGLTIFVILSLFITANNFFDFSPFGEGMEPKSKLLHYIIFILIVAYLHFKKSDKKKKLQNLGSKSQKRIDNCITLLICGQFIALFNATIYKEQSLFVSIMTSMPMLVAFGSYFLFKKISLTEESFKKIIVILGVGYCCIYILSLITLPNPLFGSFGLDEERGGFRLRIRGIFWAALLFFLLISSYKELKKNKYLILAFIIYLFIVASLARQYILWSTFLGGLFFLKGLKFRKLLVLISAVVVLGVTVIPQIPLVKNMIELTEKQKELNDYEQDDFRVRDYMVFMFEYDRNIFQYIFGCGLGSQGNSKWGNEQEMMNQSQHLIMADASWAGIVFLYGYFSFFIWIFLVIYSIFYIKGVYYKRFFLAYIFLCAILGGTLVYTYEVIIIMFVMSQMTCCKKVDSKQPILTYSKKRLNERPFLDGPSNKVGRH